MRIGEAATRTGLSARVIRSWERRGWIGSGRAAPGHRHYTDDDVDRMRRLRVLLAADLPPALATRAVDGDRGEDERARARRALAALVEQAREADAELARGGAVAPAEAPPEHRISLMFDTWIMRTRMECVLGSTLRPAGVPVGEYAVISLISVGGRSRRRAWRDSSGPPRRRSAPG